MQYKFEKMDFNKVTEQEISLFPHKSIFTTLDWYSFLVADSHVKPVIIKIFKDDLHIGYFYGAEFTKFGIKMVASPFNGWSTSWMGFDICQDVSKWDVVEPLSNYLLKECGYLYFEVIDRDFSIEEARKRGFVSEPFDTLDLDINKTNEELFKVFKTDCRNFIRQFDRRGAQLEEAEPSDAFAEEYYLQLQDVFAKQGLIPSYSCDKVKCLLRNLRDTDMILCLRVKSPDGVCIASSIFLGYNERFFFWGGASYRQFQHYRPNEYMIWYAIQYWRERGCVVFDMCGDRAYKRKFGSVPVSYAQLFITKYPVLIQLRNIAKRLYWFTLKIKGLFVKGVKEETDGTN